MKDLSRQIYIGGYIPHIYRNQSGGAPCAFCSKQGASNFCTACKSVHYCNQKCQKSHWKEHRPFCKQKGTLPAKQAAQTSHTSDVPSAKDDSEDRPRCWVCFEDNMPMNNPCDLCKGTMGNAHEECILQVQLSKKKLTEMARCSNCKRQFPPKFTAVILEAHIKQLNKKKRDGLDGLDAILSLASCYIDGGFDDDKIEEGISLAMGVLDVHNEHEVDPNHPGMTVIHSLIGRAHLGLKNYEMAIEVLSQSLGMQKQHLLTSAQLTDESRTSIFVNMVETETSIASALKKQHKYPEALKILERLIKTTAKLVAHSAASAARGDMPPQGHGYYDSGTRFYQVLLGHDAQHHDILANLADTHVQMGNYAGAVQAYGGILQTIQKYKNSTGALEIMDKMASCYVNLDMFEDALESLWNIVNILKTNTNLGTTDPSIVKVMNKIGSVYAMQDELGKALQILSDVYQDQMINGCSPEVCDQTLKKIKSLRDAMGLPSRLEALQHYNL